MLRANIGGGRQYAFRRRGVLPPAIKYLLMLNGILYGMPMVLAIVSPQLYILLFDSTHGLLPLQTNLDPRWADRFGLFQPWQLVTYMFVHGGLLHILFNMFALWMFGVEIEERWGSRQFATYYLLCGIGGGVLQIALPLVLNILAVQRGGGIGSNFFPLPVVGASGAVYGVLLAFGFLFPDRLIYIPLLFIPIGIPARMLVVLYAVISIVGGMSGGSGVAHFAHLGGMLVGYIYIKWQQRRRRFLRY